MEAGLVRCAWPGLSDPLYAHYHDTEWGVPHGDDQRLFEKLIMEGFQAGLSWLTILRKRETFRAAFHGFDAQVMARYGENDVARLMGDTGIIRNRLKIEGAILSARAFLALDDSQQICVGAPRRWSNREQLCATWRCSSRHGYFKDFV
jgi:DNA-3-methyladenine glycosylase I